MENQGPDPVKTKDRNGGKRKRRTWLSGCLWGAFWLAVVIALIRPWRFPVVWIYYYMALGMFGCSIDSSDRNEVSYFYRFKSSYSHNGEPIDFNIVVACGYGHNLDVRSLPVFTQRTRDNHRVMQIVPNACKGQTTDDGGAPPDFLPGAVWLDKADGYKFGLGYFSEDAFESPYSQLEFRGATIQEATREEWEAFKRDHQADLTDKVHRIGCFGVLRYRLSDVGRSVLQKHWPAHRPKYWADPHTEDGPFKELMRADGNRPVFADGIRYKDRLHRSNYNYIGLPTRTGGGRLWTGRHRIMPSDMFPIRFDRGLPWVHSSEVATSPYLDKYVDVSSGPGKGFLYCYPNLPFNEMESVLPEFRARESRTLVDGEWVETLEKKRWSWPSTFFEEDKYLFIGFHISFT